MGSWEVMVGLLILCGRATRLGSLITLIIMFVAIMVNKIPMAIAESFGPFVLRKLTSYGFWPMAHEMRTDFAMFLGSLFLINRGAIDQQLQFKKG